MLGCEVIVDEEMFSASGKSQLEVFFHVPTAYLLFRSFCAVKWASGLATTFPSCSFETVESSILSVKVPLASSSGVLALSPRSAIQPRKTMKPDEGSGELVSQAANTPNTQLLSYSTNPNTPLISKRHHPLKVKVNFRISTQSPLTCNFLQNPTINSK